MGTSDEAERMAREDPQPGMSRFDRNHVPTMHLYNADPMNKRVEQRTLALQMRDRSKVIMAGDKLTAMMLVEAAIALEHATFAEGVWEDRYRRASHANRV
jgi:hypothetical protein